MQITISRKNIRLLQGSVFLILSVFFGIHGSQALAQGDPDYGIEIQNNTVCSFINADDVRIRQRPTTKADLITTLNRGDGVRAIGREGDWVQVAARAYGTPPNERFEPLQGWVFNKYINGCAEDEFDRWRQ